MRALLAALAVLSAPLVPGARAEVVRPAPEISWLDAGGRPQSLSQLRGQPIVIVFAPSPTDRAFRSQIGRLRWVAERLGANKVAFVAAFSSTSGRIPSNIPFAIAADGPKAAFEYGAGDRFGIAIIGRDGNLDYFTQKVQPGQRVYDVVANSFVPQTNMRRP